VTSEQRAALERMLAELPVRQVSKPQRARARRRNYQLIIDRFPGLDMDAIYRNPKYAMG
jgi:hypothetical protein